MNKLAERISYLSTVSRLKDKELANKIGVSPAYFSQLKTGLKHTRNSELLYKLAETVKCDPVWLISGNGSPFPSGKIQESVVTYDPKPDTESAQKEPIEKVIKERNQLIEALRILAPGMTPEQLLAVGKSNLESLDVLSIVVTELGKRGL